MKLCFTGRRTELRLLMLHDFFFLADIFADLPPVEQRQDSQKGRFKASNVNSKGKINVSLQVVSPQCRAICRAG